LFKHAIVKNTIIASIAALVVLVFGAIYVRNVIQNYSRDLTKQIVTHQETNRSLIFELKSGISQNDKRRWEILNTKRFILEMNKKIDPIVAENYAEWIVDESSRYPNVSTSTVAAIIAHESMFNFSDTSATGARGLMQVMPLTAEDMCQYLHITYDESSLFDAKTNIQIGTYYYHRLKTKYKDISISLAGYNGGYLQGNRWKLLVNKKNGTILSESEETEVNAIPIETSDYVPRVLKWKQLYSDLLKHQIDQSVHEEG
jgi:hypothetical protein